MIAVKLSETRKGVEGRPHTMAGGELAAPQHVQPEHKVRTEVCEPRAVGGEVDLLPVVVPE